MIQIDKQATAARRFEDDRSKILKDGREILYGKDWKQRKAELWRRCGGECEQYTFIGAFSNPPHAEYAPCRNEAIDSHHLEKRSIKRDDRLQNLKALCAFHHKLQHPEKQVHWTWRERKGMQP